jgi:predicted dehydrogenase
MTEQKQPRVGVVGVGAIGMTHVRAWRENDAAPVAIAELNDTARETVAAEIGATPYRSAKEMMVSGEIDIVSICTPPFTHASLVQHALANNLAIICEKPLAHTLEDAERIADMVKEHQAVFTVGFCHRFQPQIETMKRMIEEGAIGEPMLFRNRFAGYKADAATTWFSNPTMSGGGPMMDTSVHSVDLFRHLVGDAVHVAAMTSTKETDLGPALETEDTAAMLLQTAAGTIGVIESSWRTTVPEWRVAVHGTGGALEFDYDTMVLRHSPAGGAWTEVDVMDGNRFELELAHFIDVWRGNTAPRVTIEDGLAANRILATAYRSAASPSSVTGSR